MSYNFNNAITIFKTAIQKQYWDVEGRTSRSDFWHFMSIPFLIGLIGGIIVGIVPILSIGLLIINLALLGPGIGMAVRRMHDLGKPWWMALIPLYSLYLACLPGEADTNRFGPNPLGPSAEVFS